ncbi:hypothetical protein [Ferruginibacter profundus]
MRRYQKADLLLNVLLPIIAGVLMYILPGLKKFPAYIGNHLPDGLWAYAFLSCILIIWNRQIHMPWLIVVFISFVVFETLQSLDIISGTGDIKDIITYCIFSTAALSTNSFFYKTLNYTHETSY